jgi:hypothetical protein
MLVPGLAAAQVEAQLEPATTMTIMSPDAIAAPMKIDLDQLRNGSADAPDETDGSPNWQNGNVGEQQGHLEEGWSIPYRARIENIPTDCYTGSDTIRIVLGYDIKHSGAHAIDFLTSYNRLHIPGSACHYTGNHNVDPYFPDPTYGTALAGGAINDWTHAYTIPCPQCDDPYGDLPNGIQPQSACAALPAVEREMRIWGGTIVNMYYADYPLGTGNGNKCVEGEEGVLTAAQSEARMVVVIDPAGENVVLAWGGHIASREDWGCRDANGNTVPCASLGAVVRSAGGISGSPYHMRLIDWEGFAEADCPTPNLGNTDRSLSAATVCTPPLICSMSPDSLMICEGSNATFCVDVSGGAGPYTYSWSGPGCPCGTDSCISITNAVPGDAGTYTVTITDAEGTESTCTAILVVVPKPNCGIQGPLELCPSSTGHSYNGPAGNYSYQWSISGNGSISGSSTGSSVSVNAGSTCGANFTLQLIVSEPSLGCADTCTYVVSVDDNEDPTVVFCPSDTTINCTATGLAFGTPSFDDNCDNALTVTVAQDTVPGDCPAEKTVTRTWTATDDCGNFVTCDQSIRIQDNTPPVITCPDNQTIDCAAAVNFGQPSATDDCSQVTISVLSTIATPGACPAESSYTRTWVATDACGNADTCSQTITKQDNTPPVITCAADTVIDCAADLNFGRPSATDNCSDVTISILSTIATPGACAAESSYTRTWVATDACGNADTCSRTITKQDITAPVLSCPADTTIDCAAVLAFGEPFATDDCSEVTIRILSTIAAPGACAAESSYTRTWEAMDACGNADTCSQTVTRQDTTDPICSAPNDTTIAQCDPARVCLPVSASDNCDPSVSCVITAGPGTLSNGQWCYTPTGDETVNVTVVCTDDCGNTCESSFAVTFEINEGPTCQFGELAPPGPCPPFLYTFQMTTTDPDGDSVVCVNTNPNVSFVDGVWSYTAGSGETIVDTIICADVPCGEACTSYVFINTPNPQPPICHAPNDTTIYLCESTEICLPLFAEFGSCSITFGPGTHVDSFWCYTPEVSDTVTVGIECVGICDTCRDSFTVAFIINEPPAIDCPDDSLVVAAGDSVTLDIPITDGDDSTLAVTIIGVTLDGVPTTPANEPSIDSAGHFEWQADDQAGVWCFTIEAADECVADTCTFCVEVTQEEEFCSLTQGAYGNAEGKFNGVVRTDLIFNLLSSPLVIGKPGRSVTFDQTDYMCIIERLPAGGPADTFVTALGNAAINSATCQTPTPLPVDKKGKFRNILLGQTITLALNTRLDAELGTFGLCPVFVTHDALPGSDGLMGTDDDVLNPGPDNTLGTFDDPVAIFYIPQSVLDALDALGLPQTVAGLLELANRALAAWPTGGASLSTINYAVDAINRGFDECRFVVFCGETLPAVAASTTGSLAKAVPSEYTLDQNYPNPFNAATVISYSLAHDGQVDLAVYNVLGQRVATLVSDFQAPGTYRVTWTGADDNGNTIASGIYFYRLQIGGQVQTRKMVLLK